MKKLIIGISMLLVGAPTFSMADSWKELFKETEGKILDIAFASTVEAGYARDMIGGRNAVVGQIPIVYVTPYLVADWGYVSGYDEKARGAVMVGGTLRLNLLILDLLKGDINLAQKVFERSKWEKLWLGPWIAHGFTAGEVLGGVKGGLRFDDLAFWK